MKFNIKDVYDLLQKQNYSQAEAIVLELIKKDNSNKEYIFIRGIILAQKKLFREAIECFQISVDNEKYSYDSNFNIGNCFIGLQEYHQAVEYFRICSKINNSRHEPLQKIGVCFRSLGSYEESNQYLQKSLKINKDPISYLLLANNYRETGNFHNAKLSVESLLDIDNEHIEALLLLANISMDQSRFMQAKTILEKIIQNKKITKIQFIAAQIDMGNLHKLQGRYDEAIVLYNEVLKIDHKNPSASYNLSICYLFLKKYDLAWLFHEKRMHLNIFGNLRQRISILKKPLWDSSKTKENILIWGEQGIGDTILYSQYLKTINGLFKKIILAVDDKLISFFNMLFPTIEIRSINELPLIENYNYHLPMGSLGFHFHKLFNQKDLVQNFQNDFKDTRVPQKIKKIRCAISWQSANKLFGHKKSVPLKKFKKLFQLKDIEFINIQFNSANDEIEETELLLNSKIFVEHPIDCFNDIKGTANLIQSCDVVITVSNSNAHIAGKLNIKTYLLLPYSDGKLWYWGRNEDEGIDWYPNIVPIRQNEQDKWDECLDQVYDHLENLL